VIFDGSEQQALLILGGMAEVARSGGIALTALDRAALGPAASDGPFTTSSAPTVSCSPARRGRWWATSCR